jgi:hypothetical protein
MSMLKSIAKNQLAKARPRQDQGNENGREHGKARPRQDQGNENGREHGKALTLGNLW